MEEVRSYKLIESKSSQKEDITEAVAILKKYAERDIEAKIIEIKDTLLKSFSDADGEGGGNRLFRQDNHRQQLSAD